MRYIYQNEVQDGRGNFVAGASVTVTLAGGTTKASIYSALTGGTVDADGIITTGTDGTFAFYVDEDDYSHSQQFRIVWSKSGFTSETWDYIQIFPDGERTLLTSSTVDQGDAAIVGTLAWHVADASTDPVTVKILPGTYLVSTSITIASTMSLNIPQKIALTDDASNADLTINGNLKAGTYQIFDWGNGSGDITFGDGSINEVCAEWWGCVGNDSTDNTTPFTEAMVSVADSDIPVVFGAGIYQLGSQVTIPAGKQRVKGQGIYTTVLKIVHAGTGLHHSRADSDWSGELSLENLQVDGTDTATVGVYLDQVNYTSFYNVRVKDVAGHALHLHDCQDMNFFNANFTGSGSFANSKSGVFLEATAASGYSNSLKWFGGRIEDCEYSNLQLYQTNRSQFIGVKIHGIITGASDLIKNVIINGSTDVLFSAIQFSENRGTTIETTSSTVTVVGSNFPAVEPAVAGDGYGVYIDGGNVILEGNVFEADTGGGSGTFVADIHVESSSKVSGTNLHMSADATKYTTGESNIEVGARSVTLNAINIFSQIQFYQGGTARGTFIGRSDGTIETTTNLKFSGTHDGNHLILRGYHLWVDATGDLRINSGAPSGDTDGTIVGTQS